MKLTVKHHKTEIVIEDPEVLRTDSNYNLIHYNQDYILKLLKEITEIIIKINYGN
jgi:hypothetical protein